MTRGLRPSVSGPGLIARLVSAADGALEAESDRLFLWIPVCFGIGAAIYFSLVWETSGIFALGLLAITSTAYGMARGRTPVSILAMAAACLWIALGFADAKWRAYRLATPTLSKSTGTVTLEGWVERVERRSPARHRLTLSVISIERLAPADWPNRVRISVTSKAPMPMSGDAVRVRARLTPLPEPVAPGAFDFARKAWFAGLGGVGFSLGAPVKIEAPLPFPKRLWITTAIERWRLSLAARIRAALPGQTGDIAAALITGERSAIAPSILDSLRHSGLAHLLAISGMHMAMIAGALFWLLRAGMALVPRLALVYPIKKWAAALALIGAAFYLVLSGGSLATQRAFLMISILFIAIMLDRPALTLRNVAIAAILILAAFPESIVDVSFQMSFAAVVGLVAFYEVSAGRLRGTYRPSIWARSIFGGMRYLAAVALTTLIASIAVAPFAAFHFHKLAQFGLLANVLAMPIFGILVMPMALATLIAMPFGLEAWPLALMGTGIEGVVAAATWVSSFEGAVVHVAAMPVSSLALLSLGGLWLALWRGRIRSFGIALAFAGLLVAGAGLRPDILIDRDGAQIAVRTQQGRLRVPDKSGSSFSLERWLLADGDKSTLKEAIAREEFACDAAACLATVNGLEVAFIRHPSAIEEECRRADVVISQLPLVGQCQNARLIVDRRDLWAEGAHAIYMNGQSITSASAAKFRGDRPWVQSKPRQARSITSGQARAREDERLSP